MTPSELRKQLGKLKDICLERTEFFKQQKLSAKNTNSDLFLKARKAEWHWMRVVDSLTLTIRQVKRLDDL